MSVQDLSQTDSEILTRIIDQANQRYLRESRVHKSSSFNILRVLSAYKEMCGQFQGRKEHIYNWIIYITKNYNPRGYGHWVQAIAAIAGRGGVSRKGSRLGRGEDSNVNRTVNQFNNTYNYNYKCNEDFEQSIYLQHNLSDMHMNLRNNPRFRQKQSHSHSPLYSQSQSHSQSQSQYKLLAPISSKMHYISFQPDPQNKQNINSANTKSDHLKSQQNRKIDNQPTRTPGEQSFIHNLPMSYGSPFVLSKITNNTKEVTQVQVEVEVDEGEGDEEEWANMKARADIFYAINLRVKGFSALLANFQAFGSFQDLLKKTRKFRKRLCFLRFYKAGRKFVSHQKQKHQILASAEKYYEQGLLKKSFKILQAFYQLKIHNPKRKPFLVTKLNPASISFIISLIFPSGQWGQQYPEPSHEDTPKSIRQKSKYFQNIEDCGKMEIIAEYFMANLKLTREQIQHLFDLYARARKQKVWQILKANTRLFHQETQAVISMRRRNTLAQLKSNHEINILNRSRLNISKLTKQNNLKQKCFQILLQLALSKKIYQKREEYLRNQHQLQLMKTLIKEWRVRKDQVSRRKMGVKACVGKAVEIIGRACLRDSFGIVKGVCETIRVREQEQREAKDWDTCRQVFEYLKERVKDRKLHTQIRGLKNNNSKKTLLKVWHKMSKFCQAISKLSSALTRKAFTTIKQQSSMAHRQFLLNSYLQGQTYKKAIRQLRICHNLDKLELEGKMDKVLKTMRMGEMGIFVNLCRAEIKNTVELKRRKEEQTNIEILRQYIEKQRKRMCLYQLKQDRQAILSHKKKEQIILSVMGKRSINSQNEESSCQTFTRCHTKMKREAICQWREQIQLKEKSLLLSSYLKEKESKFVAQMISQWREQTKIQKLGKKIQRQREDKLKSKAVNAVKLQLEESTGKFGKAVQKHERSLKYKSLLAIAKSVMGFGNLQATLTNSIQSNRKTRSGRKMLSQLKADITFKKKTNKLRKALFVKRLSHSFKKNNDYKEKELNLLKQLKKSHLKRFSYSHLLVEQHRIKKQFLAEAHKRFAIMKVNRAIVRHILHKKQLYMAFKFKAIYLCRLAFKSLFCNRFRPNNELAQSKKFRIHEHISTSYSSL